jgi:hypothetical protein
MLCLRNGGSQAKSSLALSLFTTHSIVGISNEAGAPNLFVAHMICSTIHAGSLADL